MKTAIVTSGFLPVPATKGGAVENIVVNVLNVNEKEKKEQFLVYSIYDKKAAEESKKYKETQFVFIKSNVFIKSLDRITFFVAKNFLRKKNSQSYRYIFQRLYFLRKVSNDLHKNNYKKIILENHPTQYFCLKWHNNYKKYIGKYYYHCHNEFPGTYGMDKIIKKTEKFICVSQFIANYLSNKVEIPISKCYVLKNAIDEELFNKELSNEEKKEIKSKYNIKEGDKVLLFTGRIVQEKGVKELIEALIPIKDENFKLIIVGSSLNDLDVRTKYQDEVSELVNKLNDKVIFTGFIKYDEIYKFYKIADIAILPSIWDDPAPLTVIEAIVCGLPIITTKSGGIPEYATNESAVIIKRNDTLVENISKNIEILINNRAMLEKMKKNEMKISKEYNKNSFYDNFVLCIK